MGKIWPSGASHGPGNDFWAKILNKELIPSKKQMIWCQSQPPRTTPVLEMAKTWCGLRGFRLAWNYLLFNGNPFLFRNFGSKIIYWARGCSRWPSFGLSGTGVVWGCWDWHQIICFLLGINSFFRILAQKSFPGPGDAPDGQMLAISGPHGVRGGRKWVQNDPDNFLLYPCVMKKFSKVNPLGWGWPCSSPGCCRPPWCPRWSEMGAKWSWQLFIIPLCYEKML